jgi:glycosyltransferase involved in cell wall biosynthesis
MNYNIKPIKADAKNNLSVLVLTSSFPLKNFPVGMHVYNKCKHLVQKGVRVTVLAPHCDGEPFNEIKDGIRIIRFPYFYPFSKQKVAYHHGLVENLKTSILAKLQLPLFFISFILHGFIHGKGKSIIHAHWFPAGLVGMILKKKTGKKLVLMMHHPHKKNLLYKLILKNTDFLFANSSYVLEKTLNIYPVPKSQVLPVPINYEQFAPGNNAEEIRKQLDIGDDIFVFSAGRFVKWKGFEYLIKAFDILVNEYNKTNIKLRIAGHGPSETSLKDLIRRYQLEHYVQLIGYIPNHQMNEFYSAADIFVIPSIVDENGDTEGFGLVSLEANACETPVIGSKVGGIVDVIEDGYNGFLVEQKNSSEIADKINKLAEDGDLRKKMAQNGRKKVVKNFNWTKITSEMIKALQII